MFWSVFDFFDFFECLLKCCYFSKSAGVKFFDKCEVLWLVLSIINPESSYDGHYMCRALVALIYRKSHFLVEISKFSFDRNFCDRKFSSKGGPRTFPFIWGV